MRLTTRTNLALRTLMVCAVNEGRTVRKHQIAEASNASENHLAQVINSLAQLDYVKTTRGRRGGLQLARQPEEIRLGKVMRSFEGVVPFAECFDAAENTCPMMCSCRLRGVLAEALGAFYDALDRYTLADMIVDNSELQQLLDFADHVTPLATPCTRGSTRSPAH